MADFKNGLYVNPSDNDFKSVVNGTDIPSAVKGRIIKAASADISHLSQQYFNPFTQVSTMEIPKDRRKINAYCRYFFESEPLVHAALTLHTEFPLSSIYIRHEDPEIQEFLEYMVDELDLFEFMMNAALEYWVIGEFCLEPGTKISLSDGTTKPIEEINTNDMVITHDGTMHAVTQTMNRMVNEKICKIKVQGSDTPLMVTKNHPILIYERSGALCDYVHSDSTVCLASVKGEYKSSWHNHPNRKEWVPKWIPAGEVKTGDYVVMPTPQYDTSTEVSKEYARLLGYYVSEGSVGYRAPKRGQDDVNHKQYSHISLYNTNQNIIDDMVRCLDACSPNKVKIRHHEYKNGKYVGHCDEVLTYCKPLACKIAHDGGHKAKAKQLSINVMSWSNDAILEFLIGFINGDGWVDRNDGSVVLSTSSIQLAEQLRLMLFKLGVASGIKHRRQHSDESSFFGKFKPTDMYYVDCPSGSAYKLFAGKIKNDDGLISRKQRGTGKFVYDGNILAKITSVKEVDYSGPVYNLEVEGNHSYVADRIAVHNCAFGIFDDPDDPQMWEKFILLDPDYVDVYSVPMARGKHSVRMNLLPNPMLKRIVENGPADPNTGELFAQIPSDVIAYVRQNIPMPLDPTCASYTKILGNPHNERATPLLMSTMKLLMYRDKLRSAQYAIADRHVTPKEFYMIGEPGDPASQEEIDAFKEILMSTWTQPNQAIIYHHALKVQWEGCHDEKTECLTRDGFKKYDKLTMDDEIATFNPETEQLEYQKPTDIMVYDHNGEMVYFNAGHKIDMAVTPNHRMWTKRYSRGTSDPSLSKWHFRNAGDITTDYRFRADIGWDGSTGPEHILAGDLNIDLDDYLELSGYYVSERLNHMATEDSNDIHINANEDSLVFEKMKSVLDRIGLEYTAFRFTSTEGGKVSTTLCCKHAELAQRLRDDFGHIYCSQYIKPWVKGLSSNHLQVFIDAVGRCDDHKYRSYTSLSKRFIDSLQEMIWKCGWVPKVETVVRNRNARFANGFRLYRVYWTATKESGKGLLPGKIVKKHYQGKVWCVTVPNSIFVTRRNGKIAIQGNSQGRILPLQAEFDDIEKHVLAGLMTSRAFLHGEGPTYASSSIALDVLIQRYLFFRRKMEQWLIRSVFRPIMELHGMYKPEQSELNNRYRIKKRRVPWDPEIQWEKQNLRDDNAKAQLLMALYDKGLIPADHLLKFHNIDPDIAARGIEKERGTVFDKNAKGGMPGPGGMPPMPPGGGMDLPPDMNGIAPNAGGLEMPPGGFGGVDMGEVPIEGANPVIPEVSKAPVDLPSAL